MHILHQSSTYCLLPFFQEQYLIQMNRQQLSKKIRNRQAELDQHTRHKNKNTQISPLTVAPTREDSVSLEKINVDSLERHGRGKNEQYGSLLKEQMTINRIEDEQMLTKSRQVDIDNANYFKQKYPFGFEGVKVCEGVIEKYKASNYAIQKDMLNKFEKQAEEFRRNRNNRHRRDPPIDRAIGNPQRFSQPARDIDNSSFLRMQEEMRRQELEALRLEKEKERDEEREEERRRRKEAERQLRRQQRSEFYLKREKENLIMVGNMLREIDHKLKENSSKLTADLRDLRNQLQSPAKFYNVSGTHLYKIANRITENTQSCSRIPVVMYSSNLNDSRLHYDEAAQLAPRINRREMGNSSSHMREVLSILRKNQHRLKMLTETSDEQAVYEDNKSF